MAIALTSIRQRAILAPAGSMLSAMVRPFGHGLTPIVTYTSPDGQQARRTRIVRMEGLRCAATQCADRALVLRDHLRAEQQHQDRDFQAQQYDDGARDGSVADVDLRQRREVPDEHMTRDPPYQSRGDSADERVPP